jgi:hypothetical protein
MRHQKIAGLEPFHGNTVGDQQHVRWRRPGCKFGLELGHDLGGAVAHEGHLHIRIGRHEGVDGLLRIGVWLAGVKRQRAVDGTGRGGEHGERGHQAERDRKQAMHLGNSMIGWMD